MQSQEELKTICGILIVMDWDRAGDPIAVSILTEDGEYCIEDNDKGQELLDKLDAEIEATGIVTDGMDDFKSIAIKHYEIKGYFDFAQESAESRKE